MRKIFSKILITFLLGIFLLPVVLSNAQEDKKYAISFTGIGCPHCAKVAPVLHKRVQEGGFILIEYEIYKNISNSQVLNKYTDAYGLNLGIPQIMFNKEITKSGDSPIIDNLNQMISDASTNEIYLSDGTSTSFEDFNLTDLGRYPNIYAKDRVAIRESINHLTDEQNKQIKNFIYQDTISDAITGLDGKKVKAEAVAYPGGTLKFENALKINGWILQWNGEDISGSNGTDSGSSSNDQSSKLSIGKIISLGLADSVNPCALSVLALVLIAIVTYNPGNRKKILLAGLSFVLAVLIMYFVYGFLIIKAFEVVNSITSIREFLYGKLGINFILGIGAIILGLLGLKDFFSYKPGGVGTEMPLFLRPKVNKLISKVTSPLAAFGVGIFVTLFLLPCTIGPYVILGGLLVGQGFINALPSLLLYNLIFVLPMIAVTILVYIGSKKAEDVKDWKDKNVRYMHLVAGILMLLIGILMVLGIF